VPLTAKQQRFCEEYIKDLNATQAAIRAGYSENSAHVQGPRLLENADLQAAILEMRAERSKRTGIDAAWLLNRLADEAEADVADLYDDDGNLKPVKEWPKIWRQGLVAGLDVEVVKAGGSDENAVMAVVKKIKISDRVKRLELIGRHIGVKAFEDTLNVKGLEGLGERLARASQRIKDGE